MANQLKQMRDQKKSGNTLNFITSPMYFSIYLSFYRTEIGANNATNNSLPNEEESPDLPDDEASSIDDYLSDSDEPYS